MTRVIRFSREHNGTSFSLLKSGSAASCMYRCITPLHVSYRQPHKDLLEVPAWVLARLALAKRVHQFPPDPQTCARFKPDCLEKTQPSTPHPLRPYIRSRVRGTVDCLASVS